MARGYESKEFEWIEPLSTPDLSNEESFHFLKEGYLHVMEDDPKTIPQSPLARAVNTLVHRKSDPGGVLGSWVRRWCVLSESEDDTHLLLYKDQNSFLKFEVPCIVVSLKSCLSFYSIPTHPKSKNTFAITLDKRTILFYTEKSSELEDWLQIFQDKLNLQDACFHSPLKGLPRQKALRKDQQYVQSQPSLLTTTEQCLPAVETTQTTPPIKALALKKSPLKRSDSNPHTTGRRWSFIDNFSTDTLPARSNSVSRKNSKEQVKVLGFKMLDT